VPAPSSFFAKAVSLSEVQLSWSGNASSYTIYKNNVIYKSGITSNSYNDDFSISPQQQYAYYVEAVTGSNTSPPSRMCATSYTSGYLSPTHTSDAWSISLPQDRDMYMLISVDPSLGLCYGAPGGDDIQIIDNDGVTVLYTDIGPCGGNQTSATIGPHPLKAGNYTIKIYQGSGNGNYYLTCYYSQSQDTNDNSGGGIQDAEQINFNTIYQGHLGYKGGGNTNILDCYKVVLPQDESAVTMYIAVDPYLGLCYGAPGGDDIQIVANDGVTVVKTFVGPCGGNGTSNTTSLSLSAGTYYVKIYQGSGFGGYEFGLCY